jgi:hypothetical protein
MTAVRLFFGTSLIFSMALGSLPGQTNPKRTPEQLKALYADHQGDFDYLLGDWEFTAESRQYGKFRGYWSAVRLENGSILDEYRIVDDNGESVYATTTIRAYNAPADRWELIGMDGAGGLQDFGTGQRTNSEMHIEQKFGVANGSPSMMRIRYYDIQPDRFSWTADRSTDDGKTWVERFQQIEARRIGPRRSLGPLAGGKKTPAKK